MARRVSLAAEVVLGAWSIIQGLSVTLWNWVRRPRVTENYPAEPARVYARFRGRLLHKRDEEGRLRCTACMACQKACPTLAIASILGDEGKGREKRAAAYVWDAGRCLFCRLCVEACPFDAIALGREYSTVGESREAVRFSLEQLLEPRPPASGGPG
jgi:NADH-quinone oxidoreductase subunit I